MKKHLTLFCAFSVFILSASIQSIAQKDIVIDKNMHDFILYDNEKEKNTFFKSENIHAILCHILQQKYLNKLVAITSKTSEENRVHISDVLPSGSTTFSGRQATTSRVIFGGKPYCSYECYFTDIIMKVEILENNSVASASLSAIYTEIPNKECSNPSIPTNTQIFSFYDYYYTNGQFVIHFETKEGQPLNFVTFIGKINVNRLEGIIYFTRDDATARASLLFRKSPICSITLN